jgi:hypothetical protein
MAPDAIKAQIAKYQAALHSKDIDAALASSGALAAFKKACAALPKSISKAQLLEEIGMRAGIARLVVKQSAPVPRKKSAGATAGAAKKASRVAKTKIPAAG